ncbi:MAG: NAD-dependent epimerase/dehydratase family protein [Anaerolineae bacterium]
MKFRITTPMLLRIAGDVLLVNLAFALAFLVRYIGIVWGQPQLREGLLLTYLAVYRDFSWLLTLEAITVFYLSGFYTYGRTYRSRYKALVIFQAVSLTYLLFGFTLFLFRLAFPMPRSVLLVAWFFTLCLIGVARLAVTVVVAAFGPERESRERVVFGRVKNVLVLGGAGYLGSVLVRKLLKRGYNVRVLDILVYGYGSLAELDGSSGFELIKGDFRHIDTVVQCMKGVDGVVHLGAIVGDPASSIDEDLTLDINLVATQMVAQISKGYGVQRFIFASTCSVYGVSDEVLNERSAVNPVSLYALTKMRSEKILLDLADDRFAPIILRFATICGMSPRPRFDLVVNLLAAKAASEGEITIYGGRQWRPFIHVDDAAEAIIKCLEAPLTRVSGRVYNVGSDKENYQIQQIGQVVKEVIPGAKITTDGRETDIRNYRVSFDKIAKELHFEAHKGVKDAVWEVKEAIEQGKVGDYRRPDYHNYRFLTEQGNLEVSELSVLSKLYE